MAARTRKGTQDAPWDIKVRFYVYRLFDETGSTVYVGKGSGYRLGVQKKRFSCDGEIVQRFCREEDAYAFEVGLIAREAPRFNRHPGGNGPRTQPKRRQPKPRWVKEIEDVGSRVYAARLLLRYAHLVCPSKIDAIRQVAHG